MKKNQKTHLIQVMKRMKAKKKKKERKMRVNKKMKRNQIIKYLATTIKHKSQI